MSDSWRQTQLECLESSRITIIGWMDFKARPVLLYRKRLLEGLDMITAWQLKPDEESWLALMETTDRIISTAVNLAFTTYDYIPDEEWPYVFQAISQMQKRQNNGRREDISD